MFGETTSRVVVDGYPRSGNTFLVYSLRELNPSVHVLSHTHAAGIHKWASEKGIRHLVPFREPSEAISSFVVKTGVPVEYAAHRYVTLSKRLLAIQSCQFVDLATVVEDPGRLSAHLSSWKLQWMENQVEVRRMRKRLERNIELPEATKKAEKAGVASAFAALDRDLWSSVQDVYTLLRGRAI